MSAEESYFQFPLCALAYESDVQKRLGHTIGYAVVDAGRKLWSGLDDDQKGQRRERAELDVDFARDFDFEDDNHMAVWLGAKTTHVRLENIRATIKEHDELHERTHSKSLG